MVTFAGDNLWIPVHQSGMWLNIGEKAFVTDSPRWSKLDFRHLAANMQPTHRPQFFYVVAPSAIPQGEPIDLKFPKMPKCLGCPLQQNASAEYRADPTKHRDLEWCCGACKTSGGLKHIASCQGQIFEC